jgi:glucose/arabinose dehydrogenase/plastocyanin
MKVRLSWFLFLTVLFCRGMESVRAATVMISIQGSAFVPATQTIHIGDTVMWTNEDSLPHTSTSGQPSAPDGAWDSGFLSQGQSFSHTFSAAGTFPYFCTVHPFMTASITVQAAGPTPPTVTITNPTNNTALAAPGSILIEATATPSAGTITQVQFFDGTASLGIDTTSPYSVTTNLGAGTHSLTAKATDSNGAVGTSAAVAVTVGGGGTKIDDPIPQRIAKGNITVQLEMVLTGLVSPLGLAAPDDGSGRLFVYDQVGVIHVVTNGVKMATPLLDVRSRLVSLNPGYDERGLLGVATHPNFAEHPFIYTYTSEPNGAMADFMIMYDGGLTNNHQSVIAEWRVDANDTNRIDLASRREIMRVDKPQSNHNGGVMRFAQDGMLYFTIGDGGAADDQGDGHTVPAGNGQDKTKILGKVVRIDVDGRNSANGKYGVPIDNPFVSEAGVVKEIYAYGLRNPYSFSFDRQTGDLLLGDVGQNNVEEVDRIVKGGNFGWNIKEGSFYFDPNGTNNGFVTTQPVREVPADLIDPIAQYDHDEGQAVIGGFVYRVAGSDLTGKYVTGDWGRFDSPGGRLFYLDGSELKELRIGATDQPLAHWLKGFGEDQQGNLYAFASTNLGPSGTSGKMFKIIPTKLADFMFTQIARDGTNLMIGWTGGFPPYVIQKKSALDETTWTNVATVTGTNTSVPIQGTNGFFRVSTSASP